MAFGADEALPIGTDVRGRYRTQAIVGRGGVGTVYKVTDTLYGNIYALKELANPSTSARRQFENEAQWLQALNHTSIPRVREFFEWENRIYLVMDFVDGENLEQMLARQGGRPLPETQVIAWTLPICDALHYLHSQQPPILHRDVKPANIIVTPAGHPVLVDLGIAKEHLPGAGMTATFVKKAGTEGYAPPEQYTTAGRTGPWSDVYGMGATLYELLTGTIPPTAIERVALDSPMLRPRTLNTVLSPHIDEAVTRALALRPADRFQSMLDLGRALRGEARLSTPSLGSAPAGAFPGTFPAERPSRPLPPVGPPRISGVSGALGMPGASQAPGVLAALPTLDPPLPSAAPGPVSPPRASAPSHFGSSPSSYPRAGQGPVLPPDQKRRGAKRTKPAAAVLVEEPTQPQSQTRVRNISWLLWLVAALVVLGLAAGLIAVFTLGVFTPPDRSTPQATVNGYFAALSAHDYPRAWQYSANSRNDPSSEASFAASLQTDDDRVGRVRGVGPVSVEQNSTDRARVTVTVTVQRGSPSASITYTLVLTLYDGSTWLIDSISVS